jgi:glycosyltransferase involved in cell wall biosynthesis
VGKKAKKKNKKKGRGQNAAKVRLSLCLIARDEAEFLDRCLESVRGVVDEIVVVDTGSVDETVRVAQRHGARIFSQPWQDDFSLARNRAIEAARGKWVLVLDCDEVIAHRDHQGIAVAMAQADVDGFRLTTRNYTDEENRAGWVACDDSYAEEKGYRGWFPTTKVRLWRNRREVRFEGAVHELVEPALLRLGSRIGDCTVPVHHYGYAEKDRSRDRYLEVGERKLADNPDDLRARYELAIAYRDAGRLSEAEESIKGVIAGLEGAAPETRLYLQEEFVFLVYGDVLSRMERPGEALAIYEQILERFPRSFQALNNQGLMLERQGRLPEARSCYAQGVAIAPDNRVLADNLARLERSSETSSGRLSVCVIARDEEAVIGRCLESVKEAADEIVVVDTGSVDRTVEIAEGYGATIGHFTWCDDFAAARNASLELATGDWILWLDADDYLLSADLQKVANAKSLSADQALYFTLVNEGADRSRFLQVKMFPNRSEIRFERPVHETVVPALTRLGIPICSTDAEVHHTGYAEEEVTERKKAYYQELMLKWLADHPEDYQTCFRIGHTFYLNGDRGRAREYFDRILRVGRDRVELHFNFRLAATFSGRCLLGDGQYEQAIPLLEQARELKSDDALTLLSLGDAYTKLGQYERAVELLQAALQGQVDPFFPLDAITIEYSAQFFLGQGYRELGRMEEAQEALARAAELMPEREEAQLALEQLAREIPADPGLYRQPEAVPAESGGGEGEKRISLCMIVRDEEERLGNCLESVQGLVDEIVVVDTGSVDRTVEIAESYGARIGHFSWCDDFSAARNVSLELATGDWIMWLDADDLLPGEEHDRIRHLMEQGRDKCYFFVLDDQGYEQVSCLQMRLFPNLPGVTFEMPIHEQVTPSLARLGIEMVSTDIRVVHTGYTTPDVVRAKKDRYLGIMEGWLEEHPGNYIVRSHVALTYHTTGRLDEAIDAYRKIVYESTCLQDRNYVVYTTALLFLGRTYLKKGELDRAFDYARKAEEIDPDYILTRLSLAEIGVRREAFPEALRYAQGLLSGGRQMTFFPIDQREIVYSAHLLCGQAQQGLGVLDAAEKAFLQAAKIPVVRRGEALGSLSELYKIQGKLDRALEVLKEAHEIDPDDAKHLFNIGSIYLEQKKLDEASDLFQQVIDRAPDFSLALLNLGYIAKVQGRPEEAEEIYRRAIEIDPDGVEARANLAHLHLDQEHFEEAREVFREVRARKSGLVDIDLGLLATLARDGAWPEVVELLGEVLSAFPEVAVELDKPADAARTLVRLGAALVRQNLTKCAEFAFMAAVFLDEGFLDARRGLAELHFVQAAYWKAVAQYEAMLLGNPQDAAAFERLGDCYRHLGVEDAARMCYEQSRRIAGL